MTSTLLAVDLLDVDPTNPRPAPGDVADLAVSIERDGILTALVVRPTAGGRYGVLCGSRRLTAARALGLETVPCEIRELAADDTTARAVGLAENLHRQSLDAISEARAYRRMLDTDDTLTQQTLADRLGVSQPRIAQRLKLLELPLQVQEAVASGEVTIASAYKAAKDTRGPLAAPRRRSKRDLDPDELGVRWAGDVTDVLAGVNPALPAAVRAAAKAKRETVEHFIAKAVEDRIRALYLGGRP